ncbi:hypothetical protein ACHAXS_010220 [Conticribra weissflogii]
MTSTRSPPPSLAESNQPDTILQRLQQHAHQRPNQKCISFLKTSGNATPSISSSWTFSQLNSAVDYLAYRLLSPKPTDSTTPYKSLTSTLLKRGDRVLLVYPPCSPHFLLSFLACLRAGLVAVPTYPPHPSRKDSLFSFAGIARACGARVALTNAEYANWKRVGELKDAFRSKFGMKPGGKQRDGSNHEEASWPEELEWVVTDNEPLENPPKSSNSSDGRIPTPAPNDTAFLQYTSGSTSAPKGVIISHSNLAHNLSIIISDLQASSQTVVVSWLPQYHDMGLIGSLLGIIYCGGKGYYMSPIAFLQRPMGWIEAISQFRGTHLQAPNFAFGLTARKFDRDNYYFSGSVGNGGDATTANAKKGSKPLDLTCLKHIVNGAEPVTERSIEAFVNAFEPFGLPTGPSVIYPTYGLAEHTVFVCSGGSGRLSVKRRELEEENVVVIVDSNDESSDKINEEESESTTRLLGCGFPARQNVDVRIVDSEKRLSLEENVVGEIWINSPSKAMGYFGKDDVTKEEFHAVLENASNDNAGDGYLRTGDLGFLHDGELYICGRLKDLIIVGGRNHYPQDIEATAEEVSSKHTRPGCSAAFSIRSASNNDGEDVVLVMELKDPPTTEKEVESICEPIMDTIRSEVSKEHSLSVSCIVLLKTKTVPKTTSGKISRSRARKAFLSGSLQEVYRKHFGSDSTSPENVVDASYPDNARESETEQSLTPSPSYGQVSVHPSEIRSLDKQSIRQRLIDAVSHIANIDKNSVQDNTPLNTIMDSVSLAQLKGMLEGQYAVKAFSDDYLFRDTTTLKKLVEIVKIGYVPDDGPVDEEERVDGVAAANVTSSPGVGSSGGIAGALGCPPGIVCCVIM